MTNPPHQYLLITNSNVSNQLPLVLIRASENINKTAKGISELKEIQVLHLVEKRICCFFDDPVLLAGMGFHLCRQQRHMPVYSL